MGGALHRATRVFRMYNIENRVEKVLSKEKPEVAPRHSAVVQAPQLDNNETSEGIHEKNPQLLTYLQDVKVYSTGDNPIIRRAGDPKPSVGSKAPLLNRLNEPLDENSDDGAFGYVEPQRIPPGRVSLRQFLGYLQKYRESPTEYSINRFSDMYTIKPETSERLFKYHGLLTLQKVSRPPLKIDGQVVDSSSPPTLELNIDSKPKIGPETGFKSTY